MGPAGIFIAFAVAAGMVAVLIRWLGGMRGAVWAGVALTVAAAALFFWLRHDAQGKQGWDAIGNGIGMAMAVVVTVGYWLGVWVAALRIWLRNRRS